jgi:hypothetical protein
MPFAVVALKILLTTLMIRTNIITVANVTHWRYTETSARVPVTRPGGALRIGDYDRGIESANLYKLWRGYSRFAWYLPELWVVRVRSE